MSTPLASRRHQPRGLIGAVCVERPGEANGDLPPADPLVGRIEAAKSSIKLSK
jgi:hypothetical protein